MADVQPIQSPVFAIRMYGRRWLKLTKRHQGPTEASGWRNLTWTSDPAEAAGWSSPDQAARWGGNNLLGEFEVVSPQGT